MQPLEVAGSHARSNRGVPQGMGVTYTVHRLSSLLQILQLAFRSELFFLLSAGRLSPGPLPPGLVPPGTRQRRLRTRSASHLTFYIQDICQVTGKK